MENHNQSSLLSNIYEEVLDTTLDDVREYFTKDAWMAVVQNGMKETYCSCISSLTVVSVIKEEWEWHKCTTITATQDMIACDMCNRWFHW